MSEVADELVAVLADSLCNREETGVEEPCDQCSGMAAVALGALIEKYGEPDVEEREPLNLKVYGGGAVHVPGTCRLVFPWRVKE